MNTEIEKSGEFEIIPCQTGAVKNNKNYKSISLTKDQDNMLFSAVSQLSKIAQTGVMSNAYMVRFKKGLPHTLMKFKDGGVGSAVIGKDNKIAGQASFHKLGGVAGAFMVLSVATSQYYLHNIDSKLNDIKSISQTILDYLEVDKKSELKSEIEFVNRAVNNYNHIVSNETQRISTITSLQSTEKISFKDCEFYAEMLKKTIYRNSPIEEDVRLSFKYKELLETSLKLYILSTILEAYYAQNFEQQYINEIKNNLLVRTNDFEKLIYSAFGHLKKRINNTYDTWYWKFKNRGEVLEKIHKLEANRNGNVLNLQKNTRDALDLLSETREYYIDKTGDVFVKTDKI